VAKASATKSVGVGVLCLAAVLLVIAAVSWAAAGRWAPATFAATASVELDPRGATVQSAQINEWQSYHEKLVNEPQLMEVAAERMARRGLTKLSNPAVLRGYLGQSMSVQSSSDGRLGFELKGEGADRTERILDTFVTAMVSHANASREHRVDGVASKVGEAAKAAGKPISDQRLVYAIGIFGVGALLCLVTSTLMWRKLVESHSQLARADAAANKEDEFAGFEEMGMQFNRGQ
jgi:hypothetical protein